MSSGHIPQQLMVEGEAGAQTPPTESKVRNRQTHSADGTCEQVVMATAVHAQ